MLAVFLLMGISSMRAQTDPVNAKLFMKDQQHGYLWGLNYFPERDELVFSNVKYFCDSIDTSLFLELDSGLWDLIRYNLKTEEMDTLRIPSSPESILEFWDIYGQIIDSQYYFQSSRTTLDAINYGVPSRLYYNYRILRVNEEFTKHSELEFPDLDSALIPIPMGCLFRDSFAYMVVLDVPHKQYYYAQFSAHTGALLDSIAMPVNHFGLGPYLSLFANKWLDDTSIVVKGDIVYYIHTDPLRVDTTYPNVYTELERGAPGGAKFKYYAADTSLYARRTLNNTFYLFWRQDARGVNWKYGEINIHQHIPELKSRYYNSLGNDFYTPEYQYFTNYNKNSNSDSISALGIYCMDAQGDLRWTKIYMSDSLFIYDINVLATKDSGVIVFFTHSDTTYTYGPTNITDHLSTYMIVLDRDGDSKYGPPQSVGEYMTITLRDQLILYPNPSSSTLSLANQNLQQRARYIEIYDIQSRLLRRQPYQKTIRIDDLPAGQYIYRLIMEDAESLDAIFIRQE